MSFSSIAQQQIITPADTLQYTLGAFVGQWMIKNSFTIDNPVLFNKGIEDVLQKKPLAVSDSSILPRVAEYQLSTQNEKSRQKSYS